MAFHRELLGTYILVGGGLFTGLLVGFMVLNTDPAYKGVLFGAGTGLSGGAFMAALASNTPLVGRPGRTTDSEE
jgi:hypothetical protein